MNLSVTISDEVTRTSAACEEAAVIFDLDPDIASTSTQLMPKKGILKRSSSHGNFPRKDATERNITEQSLEFKQSPDQLSDRPTTKIPKLTLTWSEKNAVTVYGDTTSDDATTETDDINVPTIGAVSNAEPLSALRPVARRNVKLPKLPFTVHTADNGRHLERQTTILYDDEENGDDEMMMRNEDDDREEHNDDDELAEVDNNNHAKHESSTDIGNSHIAGKWWFGKSTKNIPHCAKWGCTHGHHKDSTNNGDEYVTPTQKRLKEIHQLRKQLKLALAQLEDKDMHLNELRDHLRNLESMIGSANNTNGQLRLLPKKELNEDYKREKQELIDKHEIRVRQLIQEAVEARAEMTKLQLAMKQLEEAKVKIEVKDAEMMTEITEDLSSTVHLDLSRTPSSFSPSPQIKNAAEVRVTQIPPNLPFQLQAYENEAMAWRMKAAQLEMVLKDQILKTQQGTDIFELDKYRTENERLRAYIKYLNNIDTSNTSNLEVVDSGYEANLNFVLPENHTDYCSQQYEDSRKQLAEENHHLLEKIEEQGLRLNEYAEDINLLRQTVHSMKEENKKSFLAMEQMSKEIEQRTAEIEAANITIVRLQSELAIQTKAICYLEERHQVYRNTILDHHLVIKDESTDDWERGFSDPRYVVNVSKRIQTDLTQEMLQNNEFKFANFEDKLKVLKEEFSSKENSMLEHFQEIEKDLLTKSSLVGSLANQLEEADREAIRSSELHQKEREAFQEKLYKLGKIAENVPILQFEIEKLQQERKLMEYQLKNVREVYEAGLDMALAESLKKYQEQSNYWAEKVSAANTTNELLRSENIALKRSIDELKLRTQVQQADMSKRLTSSISHISYLKKQASLNRNTRDVEVDVHPRVVSKYVACRPNSRHKMTDIEKGELFDEVEERLKLCQGELNTSRQKVAILQQKLDDSVQIQVEDRLLRNKFSPFKVSSTNEELRSSVIISNDKESKFTSSNLREQIEELEKQNHELTMQLLEYKTEKENLLDSQRQQLSHHTSEINNFHKELNQELGRYENERQRLKARIAVLEKVEEERDKLLELLKNKTVLEMKCNNDSISRNPISQTSSSSNHIFAFANDHREIATDQKIRMKRWKSLPQLLRLSTVGTSSIVVPPNEMTTLRERNSILARNNARLNDELISLKHFMKLSKRTTSYTSNNNGNISSHKLSSVNEYSSNFNLTSQPMQMQENLIVKIDDFAVTNKIDDHNRRSNSPTLSLKEQISSSSTITNLEHLKIALKKSREEQEILAEQLDRVTLNFQDACRELDLYKHELHEDVLKYSHDIRLPKSRSFTETGRETVDLDEYLRWKEKAGTMFRELNRIRKEYHACDGERRELRLQLVMLRGELGLAQCQLAEMLSSERRKQAKSMSNVSAVSMNDILSSALIKRKKIKSRLLQGGVSDEFCDAMDSSSGIFFTACNSMWSLDDALFSISEPELVATKFEGAREYRLSGHGYRDFYLLPTHCEESRRPSEYLEKIQLYPKTHEEIIKEAANLKIASMNETARQKKDIHRKNSKNPGSESLLLSYEKQNVKSKQKLRNLEKQIAEIREEQAKLANGRSARQSQKMEMVTKENNEMAKGRSTIYPTTLKKNSGEEISRRK